MHIFVKMVLPTLYLYGLLSIMEAAFVSTVNADDEFSYYTSVCEGRVMDLRCPGDRIIEIEEANFGRIDADTCTGSIDPDVVQDLNCREPRTFEIVSQICKQQQSQSFCSIDASVNVFPDPCVGTSKYLEVFYMCEQNVVTTPRPTTTPSTTTQEPSTTSRGQNPSTSSSWTEEGEITPNNMSSTSRQATTTMATTPSKTTRSKALSLGPHPPDICPGTKRRNIMWPDTKGGTLSRQLCPEGSTGTATWMCNKDPVEWDDTGPNLAGCQSTWVADIVVAEEQTPVEVSQEIATHLEQDDELYGSDIQQISNAMGDLILEFERDIQALGEEERFYEAEKVTKNYLQITSTMISNNNTQSWEELPKEDQSASASNLIVSVEESAFLMADNYEITGASEEVIIAHEEENVLLEVVAQDLNNGDAVDAVFPQHIRPKKKTWKKFSDKIVVPKQNFLRDSDIVKIVFVAYMNIGDFLGTTIEEEKSEEPKEKFVNSRILSASLGEPMKTKKLVEPVSLTFEHLITENIGEPSCSYWHFTNKTYGKWSTDGCKVIKTNVTHTTCSCNHLTNFAIIMDVKGIDIPLHHHFLLSWITYVGFIISCICLLVAFFTFCMFKNLQNDRTTIHKNLCFCLFIAEVVFMAGISNTTQNFMCSLTAMVLHYFFLAAFAWMCLEGIQLYVMLVEVFEAEHSRRKYYYPFGYGVPLVIVGIAALVDFDKYGTDRYCWLSTDSGFIWAFVAPVLVIIMINTVFLSMALYIMCRHSKLQTNPKQKTTKEKLAEPTEGTGTDNKLVLGSSRSEYIASWLRGAMVLLCLLGVTWAFGILYISENLLIFAYIFTLTNALQGMFIFLFHCCMNDKVLKEYRRYIRNSTWLPDCVRDGYTGRLSSNSNQQQSFRSSSSKGRNSSSQDSKRLSNTTGSYHFDGKRLSNSSGCRFSDYPKLQGIHPVTAV